MFDRLKFPVFFGFVLFITGFLGLKVFSYFTHSELPDIMLTGIKKDGYVAGEVSVAINSNNGYKIDLISVFLDGDHVDVDGSRNIGKKVFNLPFKIDTVDLSDGKHTLNVAIIDSSRNKNRNEETIEFIVDNSDLKAAFLNQEYKVAQGHTIHAKVQTNKRVEKLDVQFLEKKYKFYPESEYANIYECFIPVDCDLNAGEYLLNARLKDFVGNEMSLASRVDIQEYNFPRQKGFIVDREKLEEEKEVSMSNKILEDAIEKWLQDSPNKKLWSGRFEMPIDVKRVTTYFGEVRTTPEKGHYLHKAVDILNSPKSVVWASQAARIIIKDRFLLTGNTIVIDHGVGVFTIYCHLEDFADVEIGDMLKKGNKIGRLGMTGYANGYHLHWELRVNNVAVNPFQWVQKTF